MKTTRTFDFPLRWAVPSLVTGLLGSMHSTVRPSRTLRRRALARLASLAVVAVLIATPAQAAGSKSLCGAALSTESSSKKASKPQARVVGDTLIIEGTPTSDHVSIKAGRPAAVVRVVFGGRKSRKFGPVGQIVVLAGAGDDRVVVDRRVELPARLEGGTGNDCLRGGSGPDLLFGEDGDDVLIGTGGRDALHGGVGSNRVVVSGRMGAVRVGPSAGGEVLQQLTTAYTLRGLHSGDDESSEAGADRDGTLTPIVLGPADLDEARIEPLLREAYDAGQAVALTNATAAHAARLRSLLGHRGAADGPEGDATAALIFVRKAPRPGGAIDHSTGIFAHSPIPAQAPGDPSGRTIELLSRVFSAGAIVPEPPGDTPENNLIQLADSYTSRTTAENEDGSQVQIVNSVWNVRAFEQQQDLYYVLQEVDYYWSAQQPAEVLWTNSANTAVDPQSVSTPPGIIQTSPASTQDVTSVTSGVSWDVGGSAGWNQMQGLNAAISGGVNISNSQTVTYPPIGIDNQSDPDAGVAAWTNALAPPAGGESELITSYNQWIWEVPFTSYQSSEQQDLVFASEAGLAFVGFNKAPGVGAYVSSTVPLPFGDVFALQQPVVLSVSPTCVDAGNTFTITGTGMYPSLVTSVEIGGEALDASQYKPVSDTSITVVAPEQSGEALPVVVQTTQGESNSDVTIEISVIDICGS